MIEVTSHTTAFGKWDLYAYIEFDSQALAGFEGWGFYQDEYVKE
jgi:hypothetical protein